MNTRKVISPIEAAAPDRQPARLRWMWRVLFGFLLGGLAAVATWFFAQPDLWVLLVAGASGFLAGMRVSSLSVSSRPETWPVLWAGDRK